MYLWFYLIIKKPKSACTAMKSVIIVVSVIPLCVFTSEFFDFSYQKPVNIETHVEIFNIYGLRLSKFDLKMIPLLPVVILAVVKNSWVDSKPLPAANFSFATNRLLDMSHSLSAETIFWQGGGYNFTLTHQDYVTEANLTFRSGHFIAGEHGGTHLDSPYHLNFSADGMADLTLHQLTGPAVRIDIVDKVKANLDYQLSVDDIQAFENKYGRIPEGAFVFMYSEWGQRWPDYRKVYNTETLADGRTYHYPGFHPEATEFLVQQRNIRGIGVDSPSTDNARSTETMGAHLALAKENRLGIEHVANVDKLPPVGAFVILAPMKSKAGTGAPVRVIAVLPE
ncbi:isatin hydrolase-like [Paramacrobiotus metropolitanus]|uniref:isatin hydrolase-like n=1 Tax=Paramacrobiotus metropolitanus TaxID=2943436 RepID=UPI002445A609|nr:isatin hydrolase-like [Paramacrobiotus metropolitanus]